MTRSETGFVEFPGSRIYYEVDGEGPGLTFLHACVAHLRMWDAQVEAFKDRYTVVRPDRRGFGRSTTAADVPYSTTDDLRRVLDEVGIETTHLVGNSCGGRDRDRLCHRVSRSSSLADRRRWWSGWLRGSRRPSRTGAREGHGDGCTRKRSTGRSSSSRRRSRPDGLARHRPGSTRRSGARCSNGTWTTTVPSRTTT